MKKLVNANQLEALRLGRRGFKGFDLKSKREKERDELLKIKKQLSPAEWQRFIENRKAKQKKVKAAAERAEAKKRRDKKAAEQKLHAKKPHIEKKKAHSGR